MDATLQDHAKKIVEQHKALEEQTHRILTLLMKRFEWEELQSELSSLFDALGGHFELEENGGVLQGVSVPSKDDNPALAEFENAHEKLSDTLRGIRGLAARRSDPEEVRDAFVDWLDQLKEHEAAENRVISEAFGGNLLD